MKMKELPELETPLDYPKCLNRIVEAAENRVDWEIWKFKVFDWLNEPHTQIKPFFPDGFFKNCERVRRRGEIKLNLKRYENEKL